MKYILSLVAIFYFISCTDSSKVTDGLRIVHYPNTELVMQEVQMKNGKKHGYAKEYFRNGKLKRLQHYLNDTLNDSSLYYHSNGQLANLQFFLNKEKHGTWKDFNKEGKLVREMNFEKNLLHGVSKEYTYKTGKLQLNVNYFKGNKDGAEETYFPNGKIKSITNYKEGNKHGEELVYYMKGNLRSKAQFKNGLPCLGLKEWSDNGKELANDIKIQISEVNEILLKNTLNYYITILDFRKDDEVYRLYNKMDGNCLGPLMKLKDIAAGKFVLEFTIMNGGHIMEEITIVVIRKTRFGNYFVKTRLINVAANNF